LITVISTGWVTAQEISTSELEASKVIPENVQIIPEQGARYKLVYPVKKSESVRVSIYDQHNRIMLSEYVKNQEGFMKSYDFSNLADGIYQVHIESASGILTKEIVHKYRQDDIDFYVERDKHSKSYRLVVKGVKNTPVYVDIMNAKRDMIFEDTIEIGKAFSRTYRFKRSLPDNLLFRISTESYSITKEVK